MDQEVGNERAENIRLKSGQKLMAGYSELDN
jgi:hypothetical protein